MRHRRPHMQFMRVQFSQEALIARAGLPTAGLDLPRCNVEQPAPTTKHPLFYTCISVLIHNTFAAIQRVYTEFQFYLWREQRNMQNPTRTFYRHIRTYVLNGACGTKMKYYRNWSNRKDKTKNRSSWFDGHSIETFMGKPPRESSSFFDSNSIMKHMPLARLTVA